MRADMTENGRFSLSSAELETFHEQGFIGPFDVYPEEEMERILRELRPKLLDQSNAAFANPKSLSGNTNLSSYDRHLDVPFLDAHIHRPEIIDRVRSILGDNLLCWRTEFFPKYPGNEGTDWHQASNFANVAGDKRPQIEWPNGSDFGGTITVWTAITDSTIDNGCLQFIPGTHREMNYDESKEMEYQSASIDSLEKDGVKRGFFGYDYRQLQIDPDWRPDEAAARSMVMKAGQCIIFWSTLMHASHPHSGKTQAMRLGFAARYVPTSVKVYPYSKKLSEFGGQADLEKHACVLVSGSNEYGHNVVINSTFKK